MIVPAAMLVEMAVDSLKDVPQDHQSDQVNEFKFALGNTTPDMEKGYLIGLQVARCWLATNPKAVDIADKF